MILCIFTYMDFQVFLQDFNLFGKSNTIELSRRYLFLLY